MAQSPISASSSPRAWQEPSEVFPNRIKLNDVQEMAWIQESHKLRISRFSQYYLTSDEKVLEILETAGLNNPTPKEISDFRELYLFEASNHDFKKGELGNATGLARLKGIDLEALKTTNPNEAAKGAAIIKDVNESGEFIEHELNSFLFERDENGNLWKKGKQQTRRQIMASAATAMEHNIDLLDRAKEESLHNREYDRAMDAASVYFGKLIDKIESKPGPLSNKDKRYLSHLKLAQKFALKIEAKVDTKSYREITKGLRIEEYLAYRRTKPHLDFADIAKEKRLAPKIPMVLKKFWPSDGKLTQANVDEFSKRVKVFRTLHFPGTTKIRSLALAVNDKLAKSFRTSAKHLNRVAKPIGFVQASYGMYLFTKPDKTEAFDFALSTLGIDQLNAETGPSLDGKLQAADFLSKPHSEQLKLLNQLDFYREWLARKVLELPLNNQQALLCRDDSLTKLTGYPCLRRFSCKGAEPQNVDVENLQSTTRSNLEFRYQEDPMRAGSILQSLRLEQINNNSTNSIYLYNRGISSERQKLEKASKDLRHWSLQNRRKMELICKNKNGQIPPADSWAIERRGRTALQSFLTDFKQQHKNSYPEAYKYQNSVDSESPETAASN